MSEIKDEMEDAGEKMKRGAKKAGNRMEEGAEEAKDKVDWDWIIYQQITYTFLIFLQYQIWTDIHSRLFKFKYSKKYNFSNLIWRDLYICIKMLHT